MKNIVIIGAGYAGINAALEAANKLNKKEATVTLIDRYPYHLAYTYLYEVATSMEGFGNLNQLEKSVAVPIKDILHNTTVKFYQDRVTKIDTKNQKISVDHGDISYDYLMVAVGSEANYYGIPGAEKYSIPLKSVYDSLAIRNQIQFLVDADREIMLKPHIRIVVAGGGFAGVEIAAELKGLMDMLSEENHYPREKLEVRVVEGANQLMPGLGGRVGRAVYKRLKSLDTEIQTNSLITEVDERFINFKNGERLEYDCLIWTAGIKASHINFTDEPEADRGGRVITDNTLRLAKIKNIFVAGDQASFVGADGKPLPSTARHAIAQGEYIGKALISLVRGQAPEPYRPKIYGYIVPLGGKWAIFKTPNFFMKGFLPYVFRQIAMLHYFYTILGVVKAFKLSFLENKLYGRND